MNEGKIAVRYARAIFKASLDQENLDNIQKDLNSMLLLDRQVPEFRNLLDSPIINVSQKKEVFSELFKSKVEDLTFRFLMLICENKRESFLPSVCRVFEDFYKGEKGIKAARITTAGALQEKEALRVKKTLEDFLKSTIELQTEINPDLIGGFVLRVDDQQLDSSVAAQLKAIKKVFDQSVIS